MKPYHFVVAVLVLAACTTGAPDGPEIGYQKTIQALNMHPIGHICPAPATGFTTSSCTVHISEGKVQYWECGYQACYGLGAIR